MLDWRYAHAEEAYHKSKVLAEEAARTQGRGAKMDEAHYITTDDTYREARLIVRSLIGAEDYTALIRDMPDEFFKLEPIKQDWVFRQLVHKLAHNVYYDWSGDLAGLVELASRQNGKEG